MNGKMEMKTVTEEKKGERGKKEDMDKESFRAEGKLKRELYSTEQSGAACGVRWCVGLDARRSTKRLGE